MPLTRSRLVNFFITLFLVCAFHVHLASAQEEQQSSAEYTEDDEFKEAVLNVTNTYRKQHNATALEWNETLAEEAQEWSERCVFEHSGGPSGENLSSGYRNASASVAVWGQEREEYDFEEGEFSKETGHFTQLVWKDTTSVGCGRTECNGEGGDEAPGWFVVCNYYPAGNVIGSFQSNVQEQVSGDDDEEEEEEEDDDDDEEGEQECPQGGVCGGAVRLGGSGGMAALWVAVLVGSLGSWGL